MKSIRFVLIAVLSTALYSAFSQNTTLRTLLPPRVMDEIIGEASGETALSHIIEMGAYSHNRADSEYTGNLFETQYIFNKIKEYGLEDAVINRFPGGTTWDGISSELWETFPNRSKLADYEDLNAMLASGSTNTDVTAKLIWIGEGKKEDIDRLNVSGKIVVTSGSISMVHNLAVAKGALGVISYNSPRPLGNSLAIPITGIGGRRKSENPLKFGFFLPPREGVLLRDRLLMGDSIMVHATVKSQDIKYELQVPSCIIKGTDQDANEVIFSAHLFEGLVKQGANDNISGSAAILEIARSLNTMIKEGRLDRPKRTIRFIWVPEFSGTIPWVMENKTIVEKTLCNINLDMVGLALSKYQSTFYMHRTTYGNPHYLNDVMQNYYDFVGLGNRQGLAVAYDKFAKRIVAPSGTDDPFIYQIDDHTGASDHEVFNSWGVQVPGIMMITWPDMFYHTSQDIADKCDATQLKRVAVIGASAAYTIANADVNMATKIASEVAGNASGRFGKQLGRAIDELDQAKKDDFETVYKRSRGYLEAAIISEKATVSSVAELATNDITLKNVISEQTAIVESLGKTSISSFDIFAKNKAKQLDVLMPTSKLTSLETKAKTIIPKQTNLVKEKGYRGYNEYITNLDKKIKDQYPIVSTSMDVTELCRLCNGKNSALDIKKMLDAQIHKGNTDLQDVINYISILKEAGLIVL